MAYAERGEEQVEAETKEVVSTKDRVARQEAAVTLAIYGASYSEIAKRLSYASAHIARLAVERGLAAATGPEDRKRRREVEGRRLERLLRGVMAQATDEENPEQPAYVRAAAMIIDRRIRLYGLDAPQEMVLYNPTERELQTWLSEKIGVTQQDFPEEADIIAGELIVDEAEDASGDN
jgi:hypothetical protein